MAFDFDDRVTLQKSNPGLSGRIGGIYNSVQDLLECYDKPASREYRDKLLLDWIEISGLDKEDLLKQKAYVVIFDSPKCNISKKNIEKEKENLRSLGEHHWEGLSESDKIILDKEEWLKEGIEYNLKIKMENSYVKATNTFEDDIKLTDDVLQEIGKFQDE